MKQIARNKTMEGCRILRDCRYLLHDRDTKYTQSFRAIIASGRVEPLALPARSPNLNAYAERWVRSVLVQGLFRHTKRATTCFDSHRKLPRNTLLIFYPKCAVPGCYRFTLLLVGWCCRPH